MILLIILTIVVLAILWGIAFPEDKDKCKGCIKMTVGIGCMLPIALLLFAAILYMIAGLIDCFN